MSTRVVPLLGSVLVSVNVAVRPFIRAVNPAIGLKLIRFASGVEVAITVVVPFDVIVPPVMVLLITVPLEITAFWIVELDIVVLVVVAFVIELFVTVLVATLLFVTVAFVVVLLVIVLPVLVALFNVDVVTVEEATVELATIL